MQVMQKHQKYFAVTDDSGRLLPYFITVRRSYQLDLLCDVIFALRVSRLSCLSFKVCSVCQCCGDEFFF